jgi:steroid 5-alpha reductase family enzyme
MLLQFDLGVLGAMAIVMVGAWAFGLAARNGGWTDVFWTWGTGLTLAAAALWPLGPSTLPRQALVAGLMAVWMLRLGFYLTPRVASHPEDARYAAFREQWGARYPLNMLFVTLPQAPATALLGLSVIVAAHKPTAPELGLRDGLAVALFGVAILGETIADLQMKAFRETPAHQGKVLDSGLWAWSRHPNYFFQWLGWLAYPLIAFDPGRPITWLSLVAPAVMYGLLRYVSGVPPLEAQMLKSRGEAFRAYQAHVSVFFPLPPKRVRSA